MRVYSWKTFLVTLLVGGGGLLCSAARLWNRDFRGAAWILIFGIGIVKGLRASLTKKGYRKDLENAEKGKAVYRQLFGRFAAVAPYGMLLCMLVALFFFWLFPGNLWPGLCFLLAAPVYQIWMIYRVRGEMDKPGEEETGQQAAGRKPADLGKGREG